MATWYDIDVVDRVLTNPDKFTVVAVDGETDTYTITSDATVDTVGTYLNKEFFDKITSNFAYLKPVVDEAIVLTSIDLTNTFISRETAEGTNVIDDSNATIKSIAGHSKVFTNLFSDDDFNTTYATGDGGFTGAIPINTIIVSMILPAGTYTWSVYNNTAYATSVAFGYAINGTWTYNLSIQNAGLSTHTLTLTESKTISFRIYGNPKDYTLNMKTWLNSGSTALDYEDYYEGIKSATATKITSDTGFKKIEVGDTIDNFCVTAEQSLLLASEPKTTPFEVKNIINGEIYQLTLPSASDTSFKIYYLESDGSTLIDSTTINFGIAYNINFDNLVEVTSNLIPDYVQTNTGTSQTYPTDLTFPTTTFTIPTAIRVLDGYGVEGNIVDFENGTFTQNRASIDIDMTALTGGETFGTHFSVSVNIPLMKSRVLDDVLTSNFPASVPAIYPVSVYGSSGTQLYYIFENDDVGMTAEMTSAEKLAVCLAYLANLGIITDTVIYPLATPVVTDISEYIKQDSYKVWNHGAEYFDCDVAPTLNVVYSEDKIDKSQDSYNNLVRVIKSVINYPLYADDLLDYSTTTEINGLITTALTNYVTSDSLTTVLASYVTTDNLVTTLADYVTKTSLATTLTSYTTTEELNTKCENYVTNSSLGTTLGSYVTSSGLTTVLKDYVTSNSLGTTLNSYSTTTEMDTAIATALEDYSTTTTVGTMISNALDDYSTTTTVGTMISNALKNYDTSAEVNTKLGSYANVGTTNHFAEEQIFDPVKGFSMDQVDVTADQGGLMANGEYIITEDDLEGYALTSSLPFRYVTTITTAEQIYQTSMVLNGHYMLIPSADMSATVYWQIFKVTDATDPTQTGTRAEGMIAVVRIVDGDNNPVLMYIEDDTIRYIYKLKGYNVYEIND